MAKYKNLGADHRLADGRIIKRGEKFETNESGLCEKFREKFELLDDDVKVEEAAAKEEKPKQEESTPAAEETTAEDAPESTSEDITAQFPRAEAAGLKIAKNEAGYWLLDGDQSKVNDEALSSKKAVEKLITEYSAN